MRNLPAALTARAEPEDMVQEMIPVALDLIRRYDPAKGALSTWLTNNLRWRLLRALTRQGFGNNLKPPGANVNGFTREGGSRHAVFFDSPLPLPAQLRAPVDEPNPLADLLAALDGWLDSLPEQDREMMLRLYGLRMRGRTTCAQEARALGLSREGARQRALKLLAAMALALGAPQPAHALATCKRCGVPVRGRRGQSCVACRTAVRALAFRTYRARRKARA